MGDAGSRGRCVTVAAKKKVSGKDLLKQFGKGMGDPTISDNDYQKFGRLMGEPKADIEAKVRFL